MMPPLADAFNLFVVLYHSLCEAVYSFEYSFHLYIFIACQCISKLNKNVTKGEGDKMAPLQQSRISHTLI
jgi:hypothetical protein